MDSKPNLAPQPPAAPASKRRVLVIAGLIAIAALGVGGRMVYRSHYFVETDDAYLAGHLHPISARIPGVIAKVLVDDNQFVHAGDVIAELDPADQRVRAEQIDAQIAQVKEQVAQANAQTAQARAAASQAQSQVAQSQATLLRTEQDATRLSELYTKQMKAISKAELDAAVAARSSAVADLAARKDAVVAAQAQISASQAAHDVLQAQIKVLQTQAKDAALQLGYNRVVAPVDGRIGKRDMEVGQRVQPGQQIAAIVRDDVWVQANFKETELANLRPGQAVEVKVDALPDAPLVGRLDSFSPASGNQFALLPADNATGNFTKIVQRIPVKIMFAPADIKRLSGRLAPGMSAVISVDLRQATPQAAPTQTAQR
ncbi:MAG: HlyD family secretion protein [Paucibacter sp.]|nr:HlyD family secretion protein [Roseateles sp.]